MYTGVHTPADGDRTPRLPQQSQMTKELKDAVAAIERHWFSGEEVDLLKLKNDGYLATELLKSQHLASPLRFAVERADFNIVGGPSMWEDGKNLELLELERSLHLNAQMLLGAAEVVRKLNKQEVAA